MVLGLLVGKLADTSLRRALLTYSSDLLGMLTRPFGVVLLLVLLLAVLSQVRAIMGKREL